MQISIQLMHYSKFVAVKKNDTLYIIGLAYNIYIYDKKHVSYIIKYFIFMCIHTYIYIYKLLEIHSIFNSTQYTHDTML